MPTDPLAVAAGEMDDLHARYERCKELEAAAQARIAKLEAGLTDLLRAPFMEWYPYAIGIACNLVGHPDRYPNGRRPKFKSDQCPCGKRREDREEFM